MKIEVPEGMWDAARSMYANANSLNGRKDCTDTDRLMYALEAALRWLAENPIVPTHKQLTKLQNDCPVNVARTYHAAVEWQRRMFLAPDPDEPIKDLLWNLDCAAWKQSEDKHNGEVREAYRRGTEAKRP